MDRTGPLTARRLRTPRAAAIAGILFQWFDWSFIVFPVWAPLISVYILVTNFRHAPA